MASSASGPSFTWSNVDYNLQDFLKKYPLPQVVKVKKNGSKSLAFKSSIELVLHDSKTLKYVEACVVSEETKFVLPYDCPAKVYQLSKAGEFSTLGELRKTLPTCRYFLITRKPEDRTLKELEAGEVLTIVFKKNVYGGDIFTCQRKKSGEINIPASAVGGFSPMATTQERKISDFVRHYSTFPIGIGLSESTLTNKAFSAMNRLVSQAKSGLITLTRLTSENCVIASSIGRKKTMFCIPKTLDLTVTAPKPLLLESSEHTEQCKELHGAVDSSLAERHLSLAISTGAQTEVLQWLYGEEGTYDEVVPMKGISINGEMKRNDKNQEKINAENNKDKSKDKLAKKSKEKDKEKEKEKAKVNEVKEKDKPKEKEKKQKEVKRKVSDEKPMEIKMMKQKSDENKAKAHKEADAEDLVEDDSGYLIPAELLKAEKQLHDGDYETDESKKEKSSKASTFGRLMDRVKGKDKKKDRPSSGAFPSDLNEQKAKSASMPATSQNKRTAVLKNKGKTLSTADIVVLHPGHDDIDGSSSSLAGSSVPKSSIPSTTSSPATTSPGEKETKKKDKTLFGTAGRKAGAKIRHKLAKSKGENQNENSKPDSPTSQTCLPPSPTDEDSIQDMYVAPIDDQLSHRPLPPKPPEDLDRKVSAISIPYDDDDLYDEINPQMESKQFKIPKDLSKLSVDGVSDVLRCLNMNEHVAKFKRDQIDGEIFKSLDDKLLGALGVADPVQRLKIKKLIKGWRPKN